jgi:hypothetical protein
MTNNKLKQIEIKLMDVDGNYSKAIVEYPGYVNMQTEHGINMVVDVLNHMIWEYEDKGKLEIKTPPCVGHDGASWSIEEEELNKRMDIIGQNGNTGIHYVSNEEADEDSITSHQRYMSPHKY